MGYTFGYTTPEKVTLLFFVGSQNPQIIGAPICEQVTLWRLSCGMDPQHLARELGFTEIQVNRLENGTMGLIGRDWVASQLLSLGCPKHVVEALQITPDCQHPSTRIYHSCVEHIDGTWHNTNTIICTTCGWIFGEAP